jgi:uncharacterized membrane protein YkoI
MMLRNRIVLATAAVAAMAGTAWADNDKHVDKDAKAIANARISLTTAVETAEKHVQGKAMQAEFEQQKGGQWVYDVEVAGAAGGFKVKIDADRGTVIDSKPDAEDDDDDKDKAD